MHRRNSGSLALLAVFTLAGCRTLPPKVHTSETSFETYVLEYTTPTNALLQAKLVALDTRLRTEFGMAPQQTAAGVLDLRRRRLAMIHPDHIDYGASVPKIGILLAYFQLHPEATTNLDPQARRELGLMIKASDNDMAAKYSRALGLKRIQEVLAGYGLYDEHHG